MAWLGVAIVAIGLLFFFSRGQATVIDKDTVFDKPYSIESGQTVILKNSARITVNGDLVVDGTLRCDGGTTQAVVTGNLIVHGNVECNRADVLSSDDAGMGIVFVVKGAIMKYVNL